MREYSAAEKMFPENIEMKFWHAVALVNKNRIDEALPLFNEIFLKDKNWADLVPRLVPVGLLIGGEEAVKKILGER